VVAPGNRRNPQRSAGLGRSPNELTEAQEALSNPYGFPQAGRTVSRRRSPNSNRERLWLLADLGEHPPEGPLLQLHLRVVRQT